MMKFLNEFKVISKYSKDTNKCDVFFIYDKQYLILNEEKNYDKENMFEIIKIANMKLLKIINMTEPGIHIGIFHFEDCFGFPNDIYLLRCYCNYYTSRKCTQYNLLEFKLSYDCENKKNLIEKSNKKDLSINYKILDNLPDSKLVKEFNEKNGRNLYENYFLKYLSSLKIIECVNNYLTIYQFPNKCIHN